MAGKRVQDSVNGQRRRGRPADAGKHAEILEVATQVFLERGYGATSMDLIARRARVSKITIYAHFSSKETLFASIIDALAGKLTQGIQRLVCDGLPPEQALKQIGRAYLKLALAPGSLALHRLVVAESARVPGLGKIIHRSGPRPIAETLAEYLKGRPELRIGDPGLAAEQFLGMILGHSQLGLLLGARPAAATRAGIDRMVDHAVGIFLSGCRI